MTGALTRTMRIIDDLEVVRGALFRCLALHHGSADLGIVIRTLVMTNQQTTLGVVVPSFICPMMSVIEVLLKLAILDNQCIS